MGFLLGISNSKYDYYDGPLFLRNQLLFKQNQLLFKTTNADGPLCEFSTLFLIKEGSTQVHNLRKYEFSIEF